MTAPGAQSQVDLWFPNGEVLERLGRDIVSELNERFGLPQHIDINTHYLPELQEPTIWDVTHGTIVLIVQHDTVRYFLENRFQNMSSLKSTSNKKFIFYEKSEFFNQLSIEEFKEWNAYNISQPLKRKEGIQEVVNSALAERALFPRQAKQVAPRVLPSMGVFSIVPNTIQFGKNYSHSHSHHQKSPHGLVEQACIILDPVAVSKLNWKVGQLEALVFKDRPKKDKGPPIPLCRLTLTEKIRHQVYSFSLEEKEIAEGRYMIGLQEQGNVRRGLGTRSLTVYNCSTFIDDTIFSPQVLAERAGHFQFDRLKYDHDLKIDQQQKLDMDETLAQNIKSFCMPLFSSTESASSPESKKRFPTLLHLACRYGLIKSVKQIFETYEKQGEVIENMFFKRDRDGFFPGNLAKHHHHDDIINYMTAIIDARKAVDYVDCTQISDRKEGIYASYVESMNEPCTKNSEDCDSDVYTDLDPTPALQRGSQSVREKENPKIKDTFHGGSQTLPPRNTTPRLERFESFDQDDYENALQPWNDQSWNELKPGYLTEHPSTSSPSPPQPVRSESLSSSDPGSNRSSDPSVHSTDFSTWASSFDEREDIYQNDPRKQIPESPAPPAPSPHSPQPDSTAPPIVPRKKKEEPKPQPRKMSDATSARPNGRAPHPPPASLKPKNSRSVDGQR